MQRRRWRRHDHAPRRQRPGVRGAARGRHAVRALSVAICFDADFPWLVRQAGRADVGILMLPTSDIGPTEAAYHDDVAVARAIENGVSILRPTRLGTSLAIDPYGRAPRFGPTTSSATSRRCWRRS